MNNLQIQTGDTVTFIGATRDACGEMPPCDWELCEGVVTAVKQTTRYAVWLFVNVNGTERRVPADRIGSVIQRLALAA